MWGDEEFIIISIIHYKENPEVYYFIWREHISECTKYFLRALVGFPMVNVGLDEIEWGKKERILHRPD